MLQRRDVLHERRVRAPDGVVVARVRLRQLPLQPQHLQGPARCSCNCRLGRPLKADIGDAGAVGPGNPRGPSASKLDPADRCWMDRRGEDTDRATQLTRIRADALARARAYLAVEYLRFASQLLVFAALLHVSGPCVQGLIGVLYGTPPFLPLTMLWSRLDLCV